jgi:hypothetical protein
MFLITGVRFTRTISFHLSRINSTLNPKILRKIISNLSWLSINKYSLTFQKSRNEKSFFIFGVSGLSLSCHFIFADWRQSVDHNCLTLFPISHFAC